MNIVLYSPKVFRTLPIYQSPKLTIKSRTTGILIPITITSTKIVTKMKNFATFTCFVVYILSRFAIT